MEHEESWFYLRAYEVSFRILCRRETGLALFKHMILLRGVQG